MGEQLENIRLLLTLRDNSGSKKRPISAGAFEQRLTDRFRVAFNVVHQFDNALLRQEP